MNSRHLGLSDARLCVPSSRRSPDPTSEKDLPHHTAVWKISSGNNLRALIEFMLFVSSLSGITVLCCLVPTVWKLLSHIFYLFLKNCLRWESKFNPFHFMLVGSKSLLFCLSGFCVSVILISVGNLGNFFVFSHCPLYIYNAENIYSLKTWLTSLEPFTLDSVFVSFSFCFLGFALTKRRNNFIFHSILKLLAFSNIYIFVLFIHFTFV